MIQDIFFHERGKQVLLSLSKGDKYVSEIANEIGATYAHTFNLIKAMEKRAIVAAEKKGRTKYVKLTARGVELATALNQFLEVINAPASKFKKRGKPRTISPKKSAETEKPKMAETATNKRLKSYITAMTALFTKLQSGEKTDPAKSARLVGRYKFLVTRQRPRDEEGKALKAEASDLVEELLDLLRSPNK